MKIHELLGSAVLVLVLLTGGASAQGRWDVSMIHSHGDTIWVQAEPYLESGYPCGGYYGDCYTNFGVRLDVSPCPLSVACSGSEYSQWYYYDYAPIVTLALQAGVDYTFQGMAFADLRFYWQTPDPPYMICMPGCQTSYVFDPIVFSAPVGTEPQSWGGIKVLFK